jgi:hypothetical protein
VRSRRCKHQWEFVGAKYNPRPDEMRNIKGANEALLREVLYGVTILTQRCTECNWVETSRVAGKPDLSTFGLEWGVQTARQVVSGERA